MARHTCERMDQYHNLSLKVKRFSALQVSVISPDMWKPEHLISQHNLCLWLRHSPYFIFIEAPLLLSVARYITLNSIPSASPHCPQISTNSTSPSPPDKSPQMSDQPQTLSIPSLLLLAALSALAVRYFFFTPSSTSASTSNRRQPNPADITQIATMFPQIPRRDIIWDLQRNGGSVAATTERILSRGSLDNVSSLSKIEYQDSLLI